MGLGWEPGWTSTRPPNSGGYSSCLEAAMLGWWWSHAQDLFFPWAGL